MSSKSKLWVPEISQNYNKNMIVFSETFTVKKVQKHYFVIIQGSIKIRWNKNTNLELAVQSQQTVTLITDTIKKPWFSVYLYRDNCQVLEYVYFNDRHCLTKSPQKRYPQHNICVSDLLQCRTGSIPIIFWQLPYYQKAQYTFRNIFRTKQKRPALLQNFFALLNILLHNFHRNLWM